MGGELADGRWHTRAPGRRIVYLSDNPAQCLLEMLVHLDREQYFPSTFQLLSVEIPDHHVITVGTISGLIQDWPQHSEHTQGIGNQWLDSAKSMAMLVPSVVMPVGWNCLLNPRVPGAAALQVSNLGRFPLDKRLSSLI